MSPPPSLEPVAEDRFGIVGRVIAGVYHVERVVAEGGFGVVYRAEHGGFRAPIALKCLKVPQHLGLEYQTRFLEQFRAEAEVMFRLSATTPSVVRPLHVDAMTAPNGSFVPFLVLEWLEGETLDAIIRGRRAERRAPLGLHELVTLLEPAAQALERAHHFDGPRGKESIAHCDLKPENVFVAEVGGERVIKILDFGVAKVRSAATQASGDSAGVSLFTPAYGAPEQWKPGTFGETGPWTDVWGLALTIAEALVGEPLIAGDHAAVMRQALDRARRPTPRTHGAEIPDAVEAVFRRALAVDPRERPRDAGTFWKSLLQAVGEADAAASAPALVDSMIPDLVPTSRQNPTASASARPSSARSSDSMPKVSVDFDFDDVGSRGPELTLDLPADEPLRRSLTPSGVAIPLGPPEPVPIRISIPTPALTPKNAAYLRSPLPEPAPLNPAPEPRPAAGIEPRSGPAPTRVGGGRWSNTPTAGDSPIRVSEPEPSLARRLAPGVLLAVSSVVLTLLDHLYASFSGKVFAIGPVRTPWIAALLLVGGLALVTLRLVPRSQDDR